MLSEICKYNKNSVLFLANSNIMGLPGMIFLILYFLFSKLL